MITLSRSQSGGENKYFGMRWGNGGEKDGNVSARGGDHVSCMIFFVFFHSSPHVLEMINMDQSP